jgi:hypothetical protein
MALAGGAAEDLIGSRVSLLSQHELRYEGTLHSVDGVDASITMRDGECVRCSYTHFIGGHIKHNCAPSNVSD